mmetsp:Transcript_68734/g.223795  ORF Transcript_68734/g.223795 Transcript_68734/m.223795 type:complete len:205 (+) Transcript_68734:608-1222(+)
MLRSRATRVSAPPHAPRRGFASGSGGRWAEGHSHRAARRWPALWTPRPSLSSCPVSRHCSRRRRRQQPSRRSCQAAWRRRKAPRRRPPSPSLPRRPAESRPCHPPPRSRSPPWLAPRPSRRPATPPAAATGRCRAQANSPAWSPLLLLRRPLQTSSPTCRIDTRRRPLWMVCKLGWKRRWRTWRQAIPTRVRSTCKELCICAVG